MPTTLNFKDLIDLPEWRPLANAPSNFTVGACLIEDFRNNEDRHPLIYQLASAAAFNAYHVKNDDWFLLASPALAGAFGAGACGVFMPGQGPRGTLAAGNTTTSVVLSTALPAAVGVNQLANRGDGRGFRIRIIGNSAGGSGKIEERLIVANTAGTTPTLVLDSALSFTPQSGDAYEILSGRVFLLSAGALAAGVWKYYDVATNSFSGNLATTNLPATISTDSCFVGLDELHVPFDMSPSLGFLGSLTATASSSTSITGQASSGDAAVLANEYRNFQIRIIQDTVTPTAVGQRRSITSHTAGPSAVYTVPAWTVTPSSSAIFVIENNGDRILLWSSASANTFTYSISGNAWDTTTFAARPAAVGAGCMAAQSFAIRPEAAKNSRHSFIFSFRGGNVSTLDLFDIAGAATGSWSGGITYGGSGGYLFTTGSCATQDPVTASGRYMLINPNAGQRFARFDMQARVLEPFGYLRFTQGAAVVGGRLAATVFVDGSTKLTFMLQGRMANPETFQIAMQR